MAEEEAKPATEAKKGKGLLFVIIGVVALVLVLIGVVAFLFMGGDEEDHGDHATAPAPIANLSPEAQALLQNDALRNPVAMQPLEKEFIVNLKPQNPDNIKRAGFAKFSVTLVLADKNTFKEVEAKLDIVRNVITDVASGYLATDLQSMQGRRKLAVAMTSSINSVLTDGKIAAVVFPNFTLQP